MNVASPSPEFDAEIAALRLLDLLDTEPEPEFDAIAGLARRMFGVPLAAINLVDGDRLWAKAIDGMAMAPMPRCLSFCDHAIRSGDPVVVPDARMDPVFAGLPMVMDGAIRFYAGMPLHVADTAGTRHVVGALCIADSRMRTIGAGEIEDLRKLACVAEALVAARIATRRAIDIAERANRQAAQLARNEQTFRQAERMARIGSWRYDLGDGSVDWSEGVYRIHELAFDRTLSVEQALEYYPPEARAIVSAELAHAIEHSTSVEFEVDFVTARGNHRRVRGLGEAEVQDGVLVALNGVFQDISGRHRLEQELRRIASTDELTGLANRASFNRTLDAAIARLHGEGAALALLLVDLDHFKAINDTHGHPAGDEVLRQIGRRLRDDWLGGAFAARLGGDEFALILTDAAMIRDLPDLAERLSAELGRPVAYRGATMPASGTIGFACSIGSDDSAQALVQRADAALYRGKRHGRGGVDGVVPRPAPSALRRAG